MVGWQALNLLAIMALPYTRRELPGWGKLLRCLGVYDDARWVNASARRLRGKLDGYEHLLDLRDWSDREFFFLARYYELATQLLFRVLLRPGDAFVDVGANVGMHTLLAARHVGPTGRVEAFEPNPDACQKLMDAVRRNHIGHVHLQSSGLSDQSGRLVLRVPQGHSGFGTFASVSPEQCADEHLIEHEVAVERGDDVIGDSVAGHPLLIKIDVEGFESRVIDGLRHTIQRYQPALVVELVPQHLKRAGSSVDEVFDRMEGLGYRCFEFGTRRVRLRRRPWTRPVRRDQCQEHNRAWNVLWLLPEGVHEQRLRAATDCGEVLRG